MEYEFTVDWFYKSKGIWDQLISQMKPKRILEVGSLEGRSTCYLIEKLGNIQSAEIHCIDSWEGSIEFDSIGVPIPTMMRTVESRFLKNTEIALQRSQNNVELTVHKGPSDMELSRLLSSGKRSYFDLIYIDGSHQAPDVLLDAILGFKLLNVMGFIVFDDYLWKESLSGGVDPIRCPKIAIDSFTNIFCRKINIISAPLSQLYVQKLKE